MTAFVRRFRNIPSLEVLTEIEQIALIDATPRTPVTGIGTGTLLLFGEFEDGPFNEPTEIFGENDEATRFGAFGYQYGDLTHRNAAARRHLAEDWNGNGFLKGKFLRPRRKMITRVDSSVGSARFSLAASLRSNAGPFRLTVGGQLAITTDTGGPANSTAVAALVATAAGANFVASGFTGGEQIGITVDGLPEVLVSFQAGDQTEAQVAARIQAFLGYAIPVTTGVDIPGLVAGTSGQVVLRDVTAGALAAIGHTAGTTAGTGNVGNLAAVTAAELAALINVGAVSTIDGEAVVDGEGRVVVYRTGSTSGTVSIAAGTLASEIGIPTATTVTANLGAASVIPAGARVRNAGGDEWVVMRTVSIPEGVVGNPSNGSYDIEIRPAQDDGTGPAASAGTITTLVDFIDGRFVEVTNPGNVSAALTEDQLDVRYEAAIAATVDITKPSREATITLSARRSDAVIRAGRQNAIDASNEGNFGRVFHTRAPLGALPPAAIADVANYRHDRVFYTYPGWQVRIPEIAEVGAVGGQGFSDDGVITIGADGPLAYINSVLNPEENPGQDTGLLGFVFGVEPIPTEFNRQLYVAFKAAGICAPRVNRSGVPIYQTEATTDLTPGRTTQKRRKFADFLQDSFARILLPYSKRLATDAREASVDGDLTDFLVNLQSVDQPDLQRLADFNIANTTASNPAYAASGISARKIQVRMLSSLDTFLVDTEIGEGVVVVSVTPAA